MQLLKLSEGTAARRRVYIHLVDATDGITPETGEAGGQPQLSKNGAAFGNTSATLTAVGNGLYYVELTAGELDTLGFLAVRFKSANTAEAQVLNQVIAFDPFDSVRLGLTALPNAAAEAAGGLYTRGTGAGQINQTTSGRVDTDAQSLGVNVVVGSFAAGAITSAAFTAGAIDAAAIATDAIGSAEFSQAAADKIWASATRTLSAGAIVSGTFGAGAIDAAAINADAVTKLRSIVSGTSDSGSTTTMVDAARTEADTDYWKGKWILFTSGTISGQVRLITAFDAGTDTITFAPATTQAVSTNTYEILPAGGVDLRLWTGDLPNPLIAGRVDAGITNAQEDAIADKVWDEARSGHVAAGSFGEGVASVQGNVTGSVASVTGAVGSVTGSVGSVTGSVGSVVAAVTVGAINAGVIDAASIATDAITAAKIATDAIGSDEFSQAAADKIWASATRSLTANVTVGAYAAGQNPADHILVTPANKIATEADNMVHSDLKEWLGVAPLALASQRPQVEVDAYDSAVDFNATQKASINTEVVDVLRVDNIAEITAVPAANAALHVMIQWLFTLARNKVTQTTTTQTLRNDADAANIATAAVSDDGTTFTRNEFA